MKLVFGIALLLVSVCEASSKRRSKMIRGDVEESTGRFLAPTKGSKKSKKGGDVFSNPKGRDECLLTQSTFKIEGPTSPIQGPTFARFQECLNVFDAADRDDYFQCLEEKGVINSPWFFHRDTPGSQFVFTNLNGGTDGSTGSACAKVTSSDLGSKGEFELWSSEFFGTKLADLTSVSVDYKVVSQRTAAAGAATNQYFINLYTRINPSINLFYDCNFVYVPDTTAPTAVPTAWKTFEFTRSTVTTETRKFSGSSVNCAAFTTLQSFLTAYPNAVVGVGNGDFESINLVTGETSSRYDGLEVCWDNIKITSNDQVFVYDFEPSN